MPTELMEQLYELLLTTEAAIIDALKPGRLISEAYEAGINHFKEQKPDYLQYLVKNFGFAFFIFPKIFFPFQFCNWN